MFRLPPSPGMPTKEELDAVVAAEKKERGQIHWAKAVWLWTFNRAVEAFLVFFFFYTVFSVF